MGVIVIVIVFCFVLFRHLHDPGRLRLIMYNTEGNVCLNANQVHCLLQDAILAHREAPVHMDSKSQNTAVVVTFTAMRPR